jgi:serine/threonine-protein kinase
MVPGECPAEAVRKELERILASPGFARNARLSRFLRVIVERHLDALDADLKESVLGIEVFGRQPGFDPKQDSTVRSEAGRLRARLAEYYGGDGIGDPVTIELPKGGYIPAFRPSRGLEKRQTRSWWPWLGGAVAAFALAVAVSGWWWVQHNRAPIAIAVLPLTNLSPDPSNDFFTDGLTDEIIRNLSILDGLAVRSRTSSFAFKGKARNVHEAGRQLNVEYIVEGSVMRAGHQLRINVQLIRVRDDFPLWSGKYDQELTDVFAIQDRISRGVVNSLRLRLGRGRRRYETSLEAYDLYLQGRAAVARAPLQPKDGIPLFEQAIAKDPSFAPAYAALAADRAYQSGLFSHNPDDEMPKMRAAADKAIELDPLLAEAHDALGIAYARDAQWERSEKSFRRAIELDPNGSEMRVSFAVYLLWPLGRIDEALTELRLAEKADPLSQYIQIWLAEILPSAGRYDDAARHAKLSGDGRLLGRARYWEGKTGAAIQILEKDFQGGVGIGPGNPVRAYLGYAYARTGRRDEAEKMAIGTNPFNQAMIFAGLGDKERALEAMERSTAAGPFRVGRQLTWPELALIRNDPRMKALRKKVGLPQ